MNHLKDNLKQRNVKSELLLMVTSLLVQPILKEDADGSKSWLVPKTHFHDYHSLGEWTVKVPCLCVLFVCSTAD